MKKLLSIFAVAFMFATPKFIVEEGSSATEQNEDNTTAAATLTEEKTEEVTDAVVEPAVIADEPVSGPEA